MTFRGAGGDEVYAWLVRPVDFDPNRTYPVAFIIHGGPQGSSSNNFHYRWNPQIYAAAGYADSHGGLPRLHRVRPGLHRRHLGRLGRQAAGGSSEGPGGGAGPESLDGRGSGLRPGRLLRRVHDQLDRGELARRIPLPGEPRRGFRPADHVLRNRGALVPGVGARRAPIGRARRATSGTIRPSTWTSGRPPCSWSRAVRISGFPSSRESELSRPSSEREFPASSSTSPTRTIGC